MYTDAINYNNSLKCQPSKLQNGNCLIWYNAYIWFKAKFLIKTKDKNILKTLMTYDYEFCY